MRIAIVGAGSWGTALAHALARDGTRDVALWARDAGVADVIATTRHNPAYLTDVSLDERVSVSADLAATVESAGMVILTVPTDAMSQLVSRLIPVLPRTAIVVSAAKGFDAEHDLTMTGMLREMLGPDSADRIAALSGPNIAIEIGRGLPRQPSSRAKRRVRTRFATHAPVRISASTARLTASASSTPAR